jgi:hypothetical protein
VTGALRPDAELVAELRVDSSGVPKEVKDALDRLARSNDRELKKTGKEMGDTIGEGIDDSLRRRGPSFMTAIQRGLQGLKLKFSRAIDIDVDGNTTRRWVHTIAEGIEREVTSGAGKGVLSAVGGTIASAIGAGFNVSGRSPLIAILIPVIGAIGLLIGALIMEVGALIALLYIVPSAIGAIILQVGVLFLAFKGVGSAIAGAFAAKNAKELQEAIKDLTPEAQAFVKSLLPLKEIFKLFSDRAQGGFFAGFEGAVSSLISMLTKGGLAGKIGEVAFALGKFARGIIMFLDSPSFTRFLNELIPATVRWINDFGPALTTFLTGLSDLGHTVMPFFERFGESFNNMIANIGTWLTNLDKDPEFKEFLDDAWETMQLFNKALGASVIFLKDFWQGLKQAGGDRLIQALIVFFQQLSLFFESDLGKKSLEGLIHTLEALSFIFASLLFFFLAVLGWLEYFTEWIRYELIPALDIAGNALRDGILGAVHAVGDALEWLFGTAVPAVLGAINDAVAFIVTSIGDFIAWLISRIFAVVGAIVKWFIDAGNSIKNFFTDTVPNAIKNFVNNAGTILYEAGRNLLQGLINGIKSKFPDLGGILGDAAAMARDFWPFSPAKEGPLSGKGDPLFAGQKIIQRIAAGIQMETPALQAASGQAAGSIFFGPGSVSVGFNGAIPTPAQAQTTGMAAGRGITNALAMRNTQLQIRTM